MTLALAQKYRNKLKSRIQELQNGIGRINFAVDAREPDSKKWPSLDYKTYDETLDEIDLTREDLKKLNLAMEDANSINRLALNELHSLEAAIDWEETMLRSSRSFVERREEYDDEGKRVVRMYKPATVSHDFVSRLAILRKRKDELEAVITKNNNVVEVRFVPSEGVKIY